MESLRQLNSLDNNSYLIINQNFNTLLQMIKNIEKKNANIIVENVKSDSIEVRAKGIKRTIKTEV